MIWRVHMLGTGFVCMIVGRAKRAHPFKLPWVYGQRFLKVAGELLPIHPPIHLSFFLFLFLREHIFSLGCSDDNSTLDMQMSKLSITPTSQSIIYATPRTLHILEMLASLFGLLDQAINQVSFSHILMVLIKFSIVFYYFE
jgi:hypothetical protein